MSMRALAAIALPAPAGAAASTERTGVYFGNPGVRNVTAPTLTPVLPAGESAGGFGVIVAPGGGYKYLAIEHEGFAVARWLAERGVAAFVLKYRIDQTPDDDADFEQRLLEGIDINKPAYEGFHQPDAIADAHAALKVVRERAPAWGVDPARIGMLGFSAGAITALLAATAPGAPRPSFVAAIYGPLEAIAVPPDAPPLFVALAANDQLFAGRGFGLLEAWERAKRPYEFHMYEDGLHGFGLGAPGTTSTGWPEAFLTWMRTRA